MLAIQSSTSSVVSAPRTEARSLSYGNKNADDFETLYGKIIDVLIKYVMPASYTGDELRRVINELENCE